MKLNEHLELRGKHSFMSPSRAAWERYDPDKLVNAYINSFATEVGTCVHEFAERCISNHIKLAKTDKKMLMYHLVTHGIPDYVYDLEFIYPTVMAYVNDAIGFRMHPEVILAYSDFCFGTADTLIFTEKDRFLRIHDLKTGHKPAAIEQLVKYAALFCLEYNVKPNSIKSELRIYQNNEAIIYTPETSEIESMANTVIEGSRILENFVLKGI